MNEQLAIEFQAEYEKNYTPALPEYLRGYRFLSCLKEDPGREIWLLENGCGKRVICKHASGECAPLLRVEKELGKYSFFPYIIDYYETDHDCYLIREYIEGDTLEELIEKNGPLSRAQARSVMLRLCECFLQLHHAEPPIIYRDLKPSNVVLTKAGECFLIDLGSARVFQEGSDQDTMLIGTAATAAPEQYGARQTDGRTDIYALGILYAYLLTAELKKNWETGTLPKDPEETIIRKAVAFDPNNRYQNMEELLDALDPPAPLPRKKFYHAAIAALSAALVCCLFMLLKPTTTATTGLAQEKGTDETEVAFESPLMRRAIASALDKTGGEAIYYDELDRITCLFVCGEHVFTDKDMHNTGPFSHMIRDGEQGYTEPGQGEIRDLSLLAHMPNLQDLVLDYQQITDISPLAGLPLTSLSLCGNPVTDLSPLAECPELVVLLIDDTQVESLDPLRDSRRLATLSITRTQVTDLAPVCGCPIAMLAIGELSLNDYGCLPQMQIQYLTCKQLPKEAFEAVSGITTLFYLALFDSGITSLEEVAMFDQVSFLDLTGNLLTNLEGIGRLTSLTTLAAHSNRLLTLSGLEDAKSLQELQVTHNHIQDFSALREFPSLLKLSISDQSRDRLLEAVPEPWFELQIN